MSHPILDVLPSVASALHAAGFPRSWPSPWWVETLTSFYSSPARQLVIRAGRRSGKSSTLALVACLEGIFGEHVITPGDVGVVAIVSTNRDEASQRLRMIETILKALDVPHTRTGDVIELRDRPIVFKVFACTVGAVSGFTSVCVIADEVAKWKDGDGVNPAREVLAAIRPTMATQPNARIILSSSPMGFEDAHALAFEAGDTDFQRVVMAPTWIANPTLTEAGTRTLEPDPKVWAREYAAEPSAALSSAFDADDIAAALERRWSDLDGDVYAPIIVIDPSNLVGECAFTCGVARWVYPSLSSEGLRHLRVPARDKQGRVLEHRYIVDASGEPACEPGEAWRLRPVLAFDDLGTFAPGYSSERVADELLRLARHVGASTVVSDQRESTLWRAAIERRRLRFHEATWTAPSKADAVATLRRLMRDRQLAIVADGSSATSLDTIQRELHGYSERVSASGALLYRARGSGNDDFVSLLVSAVMADQDGVIDGTPIGRQRGYRRGAADPGPTSFEPDLYIPEVPRGPYVADATRARFLIETLSLSPSAFSLDSRAIDDAEDRHMTIRPEDVPPTFHERVRQLAPSRPRALPSELWTP